jgi:hypothetical protein
MTRLTSTVQRVVKIGGKRYVLGLHPSEKEDLISLRPLGCHVSYVVPVSTVRIQAALAFGRAEQAARREARKYGVPWKSARREFLASIVPPRIPSRKKAKVQS